MYWKQLMQRHQSTSSEVDNQSVQVGGMQKSRASLKRIFLGPKFPGVYLTHREHQCALQLMEGCTLKEIALKLGLSPRTVEFYLKNIKNKLSCRTKYQMMRALLDTKWYQQIIDASVAE